MSDIRLSFSEPELEDYFIKKSEEYPRELRLVLRVHYHKIELTSPKKIKYPLDIPVSLYLANSEGHIKLSDPNTGKNVKIKAEILKFWYPLNNPAIVEIVSKPLSLRDIHEIDELLSMESIRLYWSVDCLGFLEQGTIRNLVKKYSEFSEWVCDLRGPVYVFFNGPEKIIKISRQDFVKRVLEPADMLKREFIEVIVESISEEELDKLPDEFREALRILLEKQKILLGVLEKLRYSTSSDNYRDIISNVRMVIEGLTSNNPTGHKVYQALKRAFITIPISRDIGPGSGASDELSEELANTIMDKKDSFSKALFKYSSKVGVHGSTNIKTGSGKLYTPCPTKCEAEFAVLQAILLLNYMIKTIKTAALRY